MITENILREMVRKLLTEAESRTSAGRKIAASSGGVYKVGSYRSDNAPQIRLTVNANTDDTEANQANRKAAKTLSKEDLLGFIRAAGFEPTGEVIPKATKPPGSDKMLSGSFDGYTIRLDDGSEHYVVFAGGIKTGKEQVSIDAMGDQINQLGGEAGVMISPDPQSQIPEIRRPRFVRAPINVSGTPKADTVMPGVKGDKDSIYMSLKAGETPKDHQQWSGATQFNDHPDVRDFVKQIVGISETEAGKVNLPRGKRAAIGFYKPIGNSPIENELKIWALYGTDAVPVNETGFSPEKIHLVVQKDRPDIVPLSDAESAKLASEFPEAAGQKIFTVQGAHKVSYPNIPGGGYAPYLHARYDSSSKLKISQFLDDAFMKEVGLDPSVGVKGVRFLVFPKDKLPTTSQDITKYRVGAFGDVVEAYIRKIIRESLLR